MPHTKNQGQTLVYKTVDAHVAGEPLRLLVGGGPSVNGRTMMEKLAWLRKHGEPLRRALMLEPRGHAGMHGALFTEPCLPKAHAGLLSMNAGGFPLVSGEAVMAAAAIALQQKLIHVESDELFIDTPGGLLTACPTGDPGGMTLVGLAGYVKEAGLMVSIGTRTVAVDVAFGGEFYVIVDSEAVGLPLDGDHEPELRRTSIKLKQAVDTTLHARDPKLSAMHGVIFTSQPARGGHLRSATVLEGGVLRRSPGVTGTVAMVSVLDAMGVLGEGENFKHEGLAGAVIEARVYSRQTVDDIAFVVPLVQAHVWMTGTHEFVVEDGDPLGEGFAL